MGGVWCLGFDLEFRFLCIGRRFLSFLRVKGVCFWFFLCLLFLLVLLEWFEVILFKCFWGKDCMVGKDICGFEKDIFGKLDEEWLWLKEECFDWYERNDLLRKVWEGFWLR